MTRFFLEGSKVGFVAGCLGEKARDWWEAVSDTLGAPTIEAMAGSDFVIRFRVDFTPVVEI